MTFLTTIRLAIGDHHHGSFSHWHETKGYVYGEWAVHRSYEFGTPGWRVTHVPTGVGMHNMADDLSIIDAVALARAINRRVPTFAIKAVHRAASRTTDGLKDNDDAWIIQSTIAEVLGEGYAL